MLGCRLGIWCDYMVARLVVCSGMCLCLFVHACVYARARVCLVSLLAVKRIMCDQSIGGTVYLDEID